MVYTKIPPYSEYYKKKMFKILLINILMLLNQLKNNAIDILIINEKRW